MILVKKLSDPESENSQNLEGNNWREYFSFNTDHKVIGIQYMVMTFMFFLDWRAVGDAYPG